MSDAPQGPGWWQATDGRWYAPDQPPAPGWWKASDGNWYPPEQAAAAPDAAQPDAAPAGAQPSPTTDDAAPPTVAPGGDQAAAPAPPPPPVPPAAAPTGVEPPADGRSPDVAGAAPQRRSKAPLFAAVAVFVVLLVVAAAVVVTRSRDSSSTGSASGGPTTAANGAPVAPVPDQMPSSDVTLTEDTVVVRGNGGASVKSIGDDGRTITIDASAEGADKLAPGKFMLLTGVTVVKVAEVSRNGGEIAVTGEPATLPEVVKDGDLSWSDQVVKPDEARMASFTVDEDTDSGNADGNQPSSGSGTTGTTKKSTASTSKSPTTSRQTTTTVELPDLTIPDMGDEGGDSGFPLEFVPDAVGGIPQQSGGRTLTGKLGSMDAALTYEGVGATGHKLSLKLTNAGEVSGTITVDVTLRELKHSGKAKVSNSSVQEFDWSVSDWGGDAVVTTDLKGLENVATLKLPPFFKLPFGIEFPAFVGGIPFTLAFKGSVSVTVSMALANSSLTGKAEITFSGDAGFHFKGGSATLDGKRTQDAKDPLEFLKGLAPGPVGVVLTVELPKASFGFGFLQTGAGVYISNGAVVSQSILPPPAQCTASNISYVLAGGVEAQFLGKEFEIARKPFARKEWNYQVPTDGRCNRDK